MHALVTGGGGFLGRSLVEQLVARGDRVRSFGRGTYPDLEALGVEVLRGDIRDAGQVAAACQNVDCVFHTAAVPGIAVQPELFYQVNLEGTRHVIDGCRRQDVSRLVYTSSPSVLFAGRDQCGIDEQAPLALDWLERHGGHYSRSKALAEREVLAANCDALATCALRPHLIWGPRDGHLVPRLVARARRGRLWRVGDGTNLVDMTYVDNAAEAHLQAADATRTTAGKPYFLSQGEPVNCWQWIDQILALVDLPPVKRSLSLRTAWRVGSLLERTYGLLRIRAEPPMTRFLAAQLAMSHWYDISAARRDFGYQPRISTTEGMERLGRWLGQQSPP